MNLDPAIIALIGTLCGGIGLKITEHLLGRGKTSVEDARGIREELRLQITSQKEEIIRLEQEVDEWRDKYYTLLQDYMKMQTELTIALQKIKDEARNVDRKLSDIKPEE